MPDQLVEFFHAVLLIFTSHDSVYHTTDVVMQLLGRDDNGDKTFISASKSL